MTSNEIIDTIPNLANTKEITRGLSGAKSYLGHLAMGKGGLIPVVIKTGKGVGKLERDGWNLLHSHIPLVELIDSASDYFIGRFRAGRDLHDTVEDTKYGSDDILAEFTYLHRKLWEKTMRQIENDEELGGYNRQNKRKHTIDLLINQNLVDVGGNTIKLADLLNFDFIINGKSIGKLDEVIAKMDEKLSSIKIGSVVHGDENFRNTRVRINGQWFMIDLNTSSIRSPYESVAKILMWLDASTSKLQSCQISVSHDQNKVFMNVRSKLRNDIVQSINIVRQQLVPFLDTKEEKMIITSYIMTYLIRELQWLEKRKRTYMAPYLIARALSFASGLDGNNFSYPLSLFPNFDNGVINF